MKKRGKKAQFYIMAAVIISGVIIALAIVLNVSDNREFNELYDLGEELKIESEKVLDYGVYNMLDDEGIRELTRDFTETYTKYKGDKKDLYFVFGNETKITVAGYVGSDRDASDVASEVVIRTPESTLDTLTIKEEDGYVLSTQSLNGNDEIIIEVDGIAYRFQLHGGEYFYFVINKKIGGQHYIVSNEQRN